MEHTYPIIDHATSTPVSTQIADYYRAAIIRHDYEPDSQLPTARSIAANSGARYENVHDAMNALAAEGYVSRQKRSGTRVRVKPRERVIDADRYRHELRARDAGQKMTSSAITRDMRIPWRAYEVSVTSSGEVCATSHQASLMGIDEGAPVFRRCTLDTANGHTPLQTTVSLMHPEHVRGTFFQDPQYTHRPGGTVEELRVLGLRPESGREWLRSRDATVEEVTDLKLYRGAIVYELTRVFTRGKCVIEASQLVLPALAVTWEWSLAF